MSKLNFAIVFLPLETTLYDMCTSWLSEGFKCGCPEVWDLKSLWSLHPRLGRIPRDCSTNSTSEGHQYFIILCLKQNKKVSLSQRTLYSQGWSPSKFHLVILVDLVWVNGTINMFPKSFDALLV